jgi:hypothetical protein
MAKSISVTVTGNAAPLRKELKRATQDLSGFAKAQKQISALSSIGYAVAGASVVRFGKQIVQAALDDQKSQALLRDAISKTTYATDDATASAEAFVKQLSLSSNIADDDLRPALSTLTRATGDVSRAQTLLALSTEIATATQKDLSTVSIAVAKASLGQTTALGKLGVPLSAAAKESGNFALAFEELNKQFSGTNAAALNTTAGKVANLSIRFNELKETVGALLIPAVDEVTGSLLKTAEAAEEGDWIGGLYNGIIAAGQAADAITPDLFNLAISISNSAQNALGLGKEIKTTSEITGQGAGSFRLYDEQLTRVRENLDKTENSTMDYGAAVNSLIYSQNTTFTKIYADRVEEVARQTEAAKTRAEKAREKFAALGQTLKSVLNTALTDARNKLQEAKDEMNAFADATSSAISGNVSIGEALSDASNGEKEYTDALKRRAEAYKKLDIASATGDLNGYLTALEDIKTTEQEVTDTQKARKTPGQLFADQIAKAKKFATDLKTLISPPFSLSEAGLSQLINLGIDSGSQVASELVAGTGSLSVGAINEGLAGVGAVAGELGTTAGSIFGGGAVTSAEGAVGRLDAASITNSNNSYVINITAGVGDPVEIGKQVRNVLKDYDARFGTVLVSAGNKKARK